LPRQIGFDGDALEKRRRVQGQGETVGRQAGHQSQIGDASSDEKQMGILLDKRQSQL
jgi:hypothetical protein